MPFKLSKGPVNGEVPVSNHTYSLLTKPIAFDKSLPLPFVEVDIGDASYQCLLDSGSTRCLMSIGMFERIKAYRDVKSVEKCKVSVIAVNEGTMSVRKKVVAHFRVAKFSWNF